MKTLINVLFVLYWFPLIVLSSDKQPYADIIVDQSGKGDFTTLKEAIEALPMFSYKRIVILMRNGIYEEHIRLTQNYVTIRGENRDSTIIRYSLVRSDWNQNPDHIGPGVLNIFADDIILENLTVENSQPKIGPHAFAIYGYGTRIILQDCNILSKGGDTVSLWSYKDGMYYHSNCYFTGAVDFVCPRGWCFIRDSKFYEHKKTAAVWHDGHYNPNQKFVLKNCSFDGVPGFELGRHHYQAQFYLIDCEFSENMADKPIYIHRYENDEKNNPNIFGERNYFYGSKKGGKSYSWLDNNFLSSEDTPDVNIISPSWTFDGLWNPENNTPPKIIKWSIENNHAVLFFNEIVTIRGNPVLKRFDGLKLKAMIYRYNDINSLIFDIFDSTDKKINGEYTISGGQILVSQAYINERELSNPVIVP